MGQYPGRSTPWLLSTDVGNSRVSRTICCYHGGLHRRGDQTRGLGHRTPGQIARRIRCEYGFGVYMRHVGGCWFRQPYHPQFIVYRKSAALDMPRFRTEVKVSGYAMGAWHMSCCCWCSFDLPQEPFLPFQIGWLAKCLKIHIIRIIITRTPLAASASDLSIHPRRRFRSGNFRTWRATLGR